MSDAAHPHDHNVPFDTHTFFATATLEEIIAGHEPVSSMDQFLIEDLTEEESKAFWEALEA